MVSDASCPNTIPTESQRFIILLETIENPVAQYPSFFNPGDLPMFCLKQNVHLP
jgi:hypothetical protein